MAFYTHLSKKQVESILLFYSLPEVEELTPLSHGISNSNYKVSFVSKHPPIVLKVSNDKNLQQLSEEQNILLSLQQWGFKKLLLPIPNKEGGHTYQQGDYFGALYPYVDGSIPNITPEHCSTIGRTLAELHNTSSGKNIKSLRPYEKIGQYYGSIQRYLQSPAAEQFFLDTFYTIFSETTLHEMAQLELPSGLIHGDLYYDNTLFHRDDLVAVLDFEQSGVGHFIFDLGVSISGTCLDKESRLDPSLIKSYLKGYQAVRSLEPLEKEWLKNAIIIGLFSIALWRIYRFNQRMLDLSKRDNYKELLKRASIFFQEDFHA